MKKHPYFLLLTCFSLPSLGYPDTLTEVIRHTLETNPDVLISVHNRLAIDEKLNQAKAGYWPSIDLTVGYGHENSDNATTRNRRGGGDTSLTRQELGLSLSQLLFDGFYVKNDIDKQESKVESAAYQVQNTSENTTLRTAEVYLEILRRQDIVELSKDNVVVHQKLQEQIHILVKGGAGRQADVQHSNSRVALAESYLVNAQGLLRDAETEYLRVVGKESRDLSPPPVEPLNKALPATFEEAFQLAMHQHPSLKVATAELDAAEAAQTQSNANFMPRIHLEVGIDQHKNIDGIEGDNDDLSAMVRMRYNLFRGGADQARRIEAAEQVEAANETKRRTQRLLEEEVRRAWNSLLTIRARLQYLQQHVQATAQVVESYKEQFKLGHRSLLDVLDSENELFNAKTSLITGQYTELLSLFRVLASVGRLLDTLGIQRPVQGNLE